MSDVVTSEELAGIAHRNDNKRGWYTHDTDIDKLLASHAALAEQLEEKSAVLRTVAAMRDQLYDERNDYRERLEATDAATNTRINDLSEHLAALQADTHCQHLHATIDDLRAQLAANEVWEAG